MAAKQIFEARIFGTVAGQEFNNVLHFRQFVEDTGSAQDLANRVQQQVAANFDDCTSNDTNWSGVLARQLTPEVGEPFANTQNPNIPGTVDSPALPSFVSIIIQERTGFASRRKRGRIYLPGVPQSFVLDGQVTAAAQSTINGKCTAIVSAFQPGLEDWEIGIYSRTTVAETGDPYSGFTPVTQMSCNPVVGTQRRRRIGSGN